MQMFRLCLQYQAAGATGTGTAQFGAQQFDNHNAFGGVAGSDVANEEGLFLEPFHRR